MLNWLVTLKGEPRKIGSRIAEYELLLLVHNGSGIDKYIVLNSLSN